MCVYLCMLVCVCLFVYVRTCVYVYLYVLLCMYVCAHMCMCVCVGGWIGGWMNEWVRELNPSELTDLVRPGGALFLTIPPDLIRLASTKPDLRTKLPIVRLVLPLIRPDPTWPYTKPYLIRSDHTKPDPPFPTILNPTCSILTMYTKPSLSIITRTDLTYSIRPDPSWPY